MQSSIIIIASLVLINLMITIGMFFKIKELSIKPDKYYEDMKGLTHQFVSLSTQLFNYQQNKENNISQIADVPQFGDDPTPPSVPENEDEAVYAAGEL